MASFATIEELAILWRPLKLGEKEKATALLDVVADTLRVEAKKVGKDLDEMAKNDPAYMNVVKSVTVDVVARSLMASTETEAMTQVSESAMGYSWSGSYLSPGGGVFIKNAELKKLGLKRQRIGVIELYGQN